MSKVSIVIFLLLTLLGSTALSSKIRKVLCAISFLIRSTVEQMCRLDSDTEGVLYVNSKQNKSNMVDE